MSVLLPTALMFAALPVAKLPPAPALNSVNPPVATAPLMVIAPPDWLMN